MSLMPCFKPSGAQAEGIIIGTLLAGYGELEMQMCACLIASDYHFDPPVRTLFGERGEENRIKIAKKCMTQDYTNAGLMADLAETLADMDYCRKIRNQYAHCQWYWTSDEGLCFVNLEDLAKQPGTIVDLMNGRRSIDALLLEKQEAFFNYVKERLRQLGDSYRAWDATRSSAAVVARRPAIHVSPNPPKVARPLMQN